MKRGVLTTDNLTIGYEGRRQGRHRGSKIIARNLSLQLREKEVICLIGPNGVGKSTLLRTIAGLQPRLGGGIEVEGKDLSSLDARQLARSIGVVLTERINVGMLSAFALVALGRHPYTGWSGRLSVRDRTVVHQALEAVGADPLKDRPVNELSDGEKQKVMIARALAQEPHVIVLDEPTAFLDLPRRVETMGLLKSLARQTKRAILLSTHDLDLALRSADSIWLMSPENGLKVGAPEDLVLSGALGEAFQSEGVHFDSNHGSFRLTGHVGEPVSLEGKGTASYWTNRALEWEGFQVLDASANDVSCRIAVAENPSGHIWQLSMNGRTDEHVSIESLVSQLRRRFHE